LYPSVVLKASLTDDRCASLGPSERQTSSTTSVYPRLTALRKNVSSLGLRSSMSNALMTIKGWRITSTILLPVQGFRTAEISAFDEYLCCNRSLPRRISTMQNVKIVPGLPSDLETHDMRGNDFVFIQ
jgi:hypothetical protein